MSSIDGGVKQTRMVKILDRQTFNNKMEVWILERLRMRMLISVIIYIAACGFCVSMAQSEYELGLSGIAIATLLFVLHLSYEVLLAGARVQNLITGNFLCMIVGKPADLSDLPAEIQDSKATWLPGRACTLSDFFADYHYLDVPLFLLMRFGLNKANSITLKVSGEREVFVSFCNNHDTEVFLPGAGAWVEPVFDRESLRSGIFDNPAEVTELEALLFLVSCISFYQGIWWLGLITALVLTPFILWRAMLSLQIIANACKQSFLSQLKIE